MERDEKIQPDIKNHKQYLDISFRDGDIENVNSVHDRVMHHILGDSLEQNDEPLRILDVIWNPATEPVEFKVKDSVVLKLMYKVPAD